MPAKLTPMKSEKSKHFFTVTLFSLKGILCPVPAVNIASISGILSVIHPSNKATLTSLYHAVILKCRITSLGIAIFIFHSMIVFASLINYDLTKKKRHHAPIWSFYF